MTYARSTRNFSTPARSAVVDKRRSFCSARKTVFLSEVLPLAASVLAVLTIVFWPGAASAQSLSKDRLPPAVAPAPALPTEAAALLPSQLASDEQQPSTGSTPSTTPSTTSGTTSGTSSGATPVDSTSAGNSTEGKQSKRILWIIPNYRAVSADTQLPPLSVKEKFWLATQDSFDYSSFVMAGILAGIGQAKNSTPEFGQGAKGYGRYYWHAVADQAVGNYMTEAIVPTIMREDPRYYTLGRGGFLKRTGYALSRLVVTRTDSGGRSFNFSEIVGNGAGAGISNLYYPEGQRTWTKTGQKWVTQVALDGMFNIAKEFWPDINEHIFHGKY